jgi:hypothetical protein
MISVKPAQKDDFYRSAKRLAKFLKTGDKAMLASIKFICMQRFFEFVDQVDQTLLANFLLYLSQGPWKCVRKLVKKIHAVHFSDSANLTLLHYICETVGDSKRLAKIFNLLDRYRDNDRTKNATKMPLSHYLVVYREDAECICQAQKRGLYFGFKDGNGKKPIQYAIELGRLEILKQLLKTTKYSPKTCLKIRNMASDYESSLEVVCDWEDKHLNA